MRKDLYARHKLRHERQLQQYGNGRLTHRSSTSHGESSRPPRQRIDHYSGSEDGSAWSDTQDEAGETPMVKPRHRRLSRKPLEDESAPLTDSTPPQGAVGCPPGSNRAGDVLQNDLDDPLSALENRGRSPIRQASISLGDPPLDMQYSLSSMRTADLPLGMPSPALVNQQDHIQNPNFAIQNRIPPGPADQFMEEQPFGLSPSSTDEFTSWLLNGQGINPGYSLVPGNTMGVGGYSNNFGQLCPDYSTQPDMNGGSFAEPLNLWFQSDTLSLPTAMEDLAQLSKTSVSEQKRQSLLQYVMQRFNEIGSQTTSAADIKNEIFGCDSEADTHVLSLINIQNYINSYWENFHDQLPILHRPTFVPEKAHDFLLLAVLIMGASMMAKRNGPCDSMSKISKFTNFVSWNLRWQLFMHADSHPPAKLWVIQTLLILEVYEKMNATRVLHERAHIYFPTTLSLMRRGSALTGKQTSYTSRVQSPLGSPKLGPSTRFDAVEQRRTLDASPEQWWNHWIAQEATRRVAFAAFILDATHAALFGHTPTLVIHEIKLPLPCDNTLWSSESPSEIGCVESSLHANGVTPISFLEGLRKTLNGQKVHTSPFGRIALLAGLLSVTWQMHQRDLDRSTLGTESMSGVQERWRPKLLRAFDWWKRDYEDGIAHVRHAAFDWQKLGLSRSGGSDDGDAFQSLGTVLYHIGHITVHISMPELCIFVGVKQILGRNVSSMEWKRTEAKIKEWVASPGAIGGVFHALQLIKLILLGQGESFYGQKSLRSVGVGLSPSFDASSYTRYDACNDNLLTRAWALYYASLVLWAYGFVLDGPLENYPERLQYPENLAFPQQSMRANETPLGGSSTVDAPNLNRDLTTVSHERYSDLKKYLDIMIPPHVDSAKAFHLHQHEVGVVGHRNQVVGLLSVVDRALYGTTWELLTEARHRLQMAASLLKRPRDSGM